METWGCFCYNEKWFIRMHIIKKRMCRFINLINMFLGKLENIARLMGGIGAIAYR